MSEYDICCIASHKLVDFDVQYPTDEVQRAHVIHHNQHIRRDD
jgi:hypothetical protein